MQQPNDEGRKNSANVPNLSLSGKFSPVIFAFLQRARNIMFRFVPGRTDVCWIETRAVIKQTNNRLFEIFALFEII